MRTLPFLVALALAPMASAADHLPWKSGHPGDLTGWSVHNMPAGERLEASGGGVAIACGADTYSVRPVQLDAGQYPTLVLDIAVVSNPQEGTWRSTGRRRAG